MRPTADNWPERGASSASTRWRAWWSKTSYSAMRRKRVGRALALDTRNTFIQSEHRLTAAVGVEDLLIVDTEDALLVCPRDEAQRVREIVAWLAERGLDRYL